MEKLCIVKRRKRRIPGVELASDPQTQAEMASCFRENVYDLLSYSTNNQFGVKKATGSSLPPLPEKSGNAVSLHLTSEQCDSILSGNIEGYLTEGVSYAMNLETKHHEDGHITLNLHFDSLRNQRMLKSEHVCGMLGVSRSFLKKLVKANTLKSYKLGRLRRFSLDDVLEYLTENEETQRYVK
jgi:excisionase family DNA binding protein